MIFFQDSRSPRCAFGWFIGSGYMNHMSLGTLQKNDFGLSRWYLTRWFWLQMQKCPNVIFYVFLHISTSCRLNTRKDRMDPRQVVAVGVMLYHPHAREQIISSESLLKIIMKSRPFRLSKIINFFNRKSWQLLRQGSVPNFLRGIWR